MLLLSLHAYCSPAHPHVAALSDHSSSDAEEVPAKGKGKGKGKQPVQEDPVEDEDEDDSDIAEDEYAHTNILGRFALKLRQICGRGNPRSPVPKGV